MIALPRAKRPNMYSFSCLDHHVQCTVRNAILVCRSVGNGDVRNITTYTRMRLKHTAGASMHQTVHHATYSILSIPSTSFSPERKNGCGGALELIHYIAGGSPHCKYLASDTCMANLRRSIYHLSNALAPKPSAPGY